jgi:hypothetical protein
MVKTVLKKTVGVICPHEKPSKEFQRAVSFFKTIKGKRSMKLFCFSAIADLA